MLLPGSGGLAIFGDDTHYTHAADWYNAHCLDVLLVDYKSTWRLAGKPAVGDTGEKIAWAAQAALDQVSSTGRPAIAAENAAIDANRRSRQRQIQVPEGHVPPPAKQPIVLVGWSLGGEGIWVATDPASPRFMPDVSAAVAYYPSNQTSRSLRPAVATLVLTGDADDVTPLDDMTASVGNSPNLTVVRLSGAHHAFDVESLKTPRIMRFPPLIGRKATLQYSGTATRTALREIASFLDVNGLGCRGNNTAR
ncbi:MAG: dienelactone hydrolase family protein [Pseudomonadales bacterium]|nr:dienelactone hydrolase family protein [Pseudomonadales bacterium]MCP5182387.1 dienelactone hydrolase family protein [Pseudomonadales bacterium]